MKSAFLHSVLSSYRPLSNTDCVNAGVIPVPSFTCCLVEFKGSFALGLQGPAEDISVLVLASALINDGIK